jgi:hypothetical protein
VNEWFQNLHSFLQAAEQRAADAAKKGANLLRQAADWIDAQASGEKFAIVEIDDKDLEAIDGRIKELSAKFREVEAGPGEKKIDPATILLILQLVSTIIEAIRKRRNPQPPAPPA